MHLFLPIPSHGESRAASSSDGAASRVEILDREVADLRRRVETLTIASQALWELLRERADFVDELLLEKMEEIDRRDGIADGRITPRPIQCPNCKRGSGSPRRNCLYCGTPMPVENIFEQK